jgi:hypothetical protein
MWTLETLQDQLRDDLPDYTIMRGDDSLAIKDALGPIAYIILDYDNEADEQIAVVAFATDCSARLGASVALVLNDYLATYVADEEFRAYKVDRAEELA